MEPFLSLTDLLLSVAILGVVINIALNVNKPRNEITEKVVIKEIHKEAQVKYKPVEKSERKKPISYTDEELYKREMANK